MGGIPQQNPAPGEGGRAVSGEGLDLQVASATPLDEFPLVDVVREPADGMDSGVRRLNLPPAGEVGAKCVHERLLPLRAGAADVPGIVAAFDELRQHGLLQEG